MSFHVPSNQTVSWTVYNQAVGRESGLPHDFLAGERKRINRAFDHGEPIWMVCDELKLVYRLRPKPELTPLQFARKYGRVVHT